MDILLIFSQVVIAYDLRFMYDKGSEMKGMNPVSTGDNCGVDRESTESETKNIVVGKERTGTVEDLEYRTLRQTKGLCDTGKYTVTDTCTVKTPKNVEER